MATRMTTISRQTKMAIGQRIKYFRNRIGMTQKQLGEQLGFKGKKPQMPAWLSK